MLHLRLGEMEIFRLFHSAGKPWFLLRRSVFAQQPCRRCGHQIPLWIEDRNAIHIFRVGILEQHQLSRQIFILHIPTFHHIVATGVRQA